MYGECVEDFIEVGDIDGEIGDIGDVEWNEVDIVYFVFFGNQLWNDMMFCFV